MKTVKRLFVFFTVLLIAAQAACAPALADCSIPPKDGHDVYGNAGIVIEDSDELYIEITGFAEEENCDEFCAEFFVVNRSGLPIEIGTDYSAVNGFVVSSYMYGVMAPGRRSILYLEMLREDIRRLGLESADELEFSLFVNESGSEPVKTILRRNYTVYPSGKSPEEIARPGMDDFYREFEFRNEYADFRIYDAKYLKDGSFYVFNCVAENLTGSTIQLALANVSADGRSIDPYWLCTIPAGKKILTDIFFDNDHLRESGVYDVDEFIFNFEVYDGSKSYWENGSYPLFSSRMTFAPAKG